MKTIKTNRIFILMFLVLLGFAAVLIAYGRSMDRELSLAKTKLQPLPQATKSIEDPKSGKLPLQKYIPNKYHVFQTFNNCAPAALSMAFSYFGITASQEKLAEELRPYNNLRGDNDDKSTPPNELAEKAEEYGLITYFRPNGDIETVKRFLANDIPVVVRTLLYADKDYAHYRVIKGYDDNTMQFIQDDSLQGKDLRYSYRDFLRLWKPFNYGYLVMVPKDKKEIAEAIIGTKIDDKLAWQNAQLAASQDLESDPNDINARFNLSVADYYLGAYDQSVAQFEKIENELPPHVLWYQHEPITAYYELGNYEKVFALTDSIINNNNKAVTELYILRGNSYLKQGNTELARVEFEKAVFYNKYSKNAQEALLSLR